jgi:hypothetical protein
MLAKLLGFSVRAPIALILFILVATAIVTSQDLKQFDFKNYSYPKLLAYFHAGDRAYLGLYRVYAQNKELDVELYDPNKRTGDCCSSGFIRTRYRWNAGKFEPVGKKEFGTSETPSRLAVSPFGIHP